jgi:hypothetical protein
MDPARLFGGLGGGGGGGSGGGPSGPLDPTEKRKLIKEIKAELKPLINALSEAQVEKATGILKTQLRKVDADLAEHVQKLKQKINFDVARAKKEAVELTAACT